MTYVLILPYDGHVQYYSRSTERLLLTGIDTLILFLSCDVYTLLKFEFSYFKLIAIWLFVLKHVKYGCQDQTLFLAKLCLPSSKFIVVSDFSLILQYFSSYNYFVDSGFFRLNQNRPFTRVTKESIPSYLQFQSYSDLEGKSK